ncbi:hypothetical protein [Methylomicrobium sp. Wu6]|uniref:hypothetical protein n=1 Tax=Methylomicrobium sp. Wu6 TaxID=3107928 RepID=UPI002DD6AB5E|nr:hypothetical protein [Methylomicrobium sp. Wu6]MEC4749233.1 hypothetical protein [Methylomicrobium sp. Wu6]
MNQWNDNVKKFVDRSHSYVWGTIGKEMRQDKNSATTGFLQFPSFAQEAIYLGKLPLPPSPSPFPKLERVFLSP